MSKSDFILVCNAARKLKVVHELFDASDAEKRPILTLELDLGFLADANENWKVIAKAWKLLRKL